METDALEPGAVPAGGTAVSAGDGELRAALAYYATHFLGVPTQQAIQLVDAGMLELEDDGSRTSRSAPADAPGGEPAAAEFFAAIRRSAAATPRTGRSQKDRSSADADDDSRSLASRIERLTPKQQEAVWLKFSQGFGAKAIARITGLSVRNVGFLLHFALSNLGGREAPDDQAPSAARVLDYVLGEMGDTVQAAFATEIQRDKPTQARVAELSRLIAELTALLPHHRARLEPTQRNLSRRSGGWLQRVIVGAVLVGVAAAICVVIMRWKGRASTEAVSPEPPMETAPMKPDPWRLTSTAAPPNGSHEGNSHEGGGNRPRRVSAFENQVLRATPSPGDAPIVIAHSVSPAGGGTGGSPPFLNAGGGAGGSGLLELPSGAPGTGNGGADGALDVVPSRPAAAGPSPAPAVRIPMTETNPPPPPGLGAAAPSAVRYPGNRPLSPSAAPELATMKDASRASPSQPLAAPEAEIAIVAALRTALAAKRWPAPEAVGAQALLEYFSSEGTTAAETAVPVAVSVEVAASPWAGDRRLVRVVVQAAPVTRTVNANLVLLIDVSGSMDAPNRLPLVREAVRRILLHLRPVDRVAIVTYAGDARLVLPSTPAERAPEILAAISTLEPKGLTHGSAGLRRAYEVARDNLVIGGVNRVVLCTDGDFNLGETNEVALAALVEAQARGGVGLDVYGFGRGRRIDPRLEALATHGRGRSGNLNTRREAERELAPAVGGGRPLVATDLRLDFDWGGAAPRPIKLVGANTNFLPAEATGRRSLELGTLAAGEIASALFEVLPADSGAESGRIESPGLTVRVGYRSVASGQAQLLSLPVTDAGVTFAAGSPHLKFAAAVAGLGRALRSPPPSLQALNGVVSWAEAAAADMAFHDPAGYRAEFLALAREARDLAESEAARD